MSDDSVSESQDEVVVDVEEEIQLQEFDISTGGKVELKSISGVHLSPQKKAASLFFTRDETASQQAPLMGLPSLATKENVIQATDADFNDIAEFLKLGGAAAVAELNALDGEVMEAPDYSLPSYELSTSETGVRFAYEIFFIILIVFNFLEIPFRMAFQPPLTLGYWIVASLIDFLFVTDLILRFFLPFQSSGGYFVTDGPRIRDHYLRSWFTPDILSSIPWDFITLLLYITNYENAEVVTPVAFRYLRLTRLTRVFHVTSRLKKWEVTLDISSTFFRLSRLLLLVLLWIHVFACFWYVIAEANGFVSSSWAAKETLQAADITTQYISSLYWSVTTFTTVGYGDLTPGNNGERVYAIFTMLFATFVMSYITGNVVSWLQSSESQRQELSEQLAYYKRYLKYRDIPDNLGSKILKYFRLQGLTKFYKFNDNDVLMKLTPALRTEVCWHMKDTLLRDWELLEDKSPSFITSCILRLKRESRAPGENICIQGAVAHKFFVLTSGLAAIIRDGEWVATLAPGAQFGEAALFSKKCLRKATVTAQTPCELFSLKSSDVNTLLTMFPEYREAFECYASKKAEGYNASTPASLKTLAKGNDKGKKSKRSKKKHSLLDYAEEDLSPIVASAKNALPVQFSGEELVRFLKRAMRIDRVGATGVGEYLNQEGFLIHTKDESREFRDSPVLYRWVGEDEEVRHHHHQISYAPTKDVHSLLRKTKKMERHHHKIKPSKGLRVFDDVDHEVDFEERALRSKSPKPSISGIPTIQAQMSEQLETIMQSRESRNEFKLYLLDIDPADANAFSFLRKSRHYMYAESIAARIRTMKDLFDRYLAPGAESHLSFPESLSNDAKEALRQDPVRSSRLDNLMVSLQQYCVDQVEARLPAFNAQAQDPPRNPALALRRESNRKIFGGTVGKDII